MNDIQKQFEAWSLSQKWCIDKADGFYINTYVGSAWQAWQASRKALVVELPESPKINSGDEFFGGVLVGHDTCKRKVIEALDAAGVSCK